VAGQIIARSDGVPLFVEELTRTVLESGLLQERAGRYELAGPLPPLAIPGTLQDSLMARLDRLASVKDVAQLGAVLGREFRYSLLAAVSGLEDVPLREALDQLIGAGLLFRRGQPPQAIYSFKHALIQDAAYASLLRSHRQQLHAQAARALETRFPEVVETQPELVAHHYTEAGLVSPAISYWLQAGQRAGAGSSHQEAIAHLRNGLRLLDQLPASAERAQHELPLQIALGYSLVALGGVASAAAEESFARCLALSRTIGNAPELFPAIYGLALFHVARAEYAEALELAETCRRLAEAQQNAGLLGLTFFGLAAARFFRGEFRLAREAAERGVALYDERQHAGLARTYSRDFGVMCLLYKGWTSSLTGYPDAARRELQACVALARRLEHRHGLASALGNVAYGYHFLRESSAALALAEEERDLAGAERFVYWRAHADVMIGWALADLGRTTEGLALLGEGIAAWRSVGSRVCLPSYLARHAEAYRDAGQIQAALATVEEGLRHVAQTGERLFESELYRMRGELRSAEDKAAAGADLMRAVAVARGQEAKLFELRAAASLAQHWRDQGRASEARALLAPVYDWFTEGFDTADLTAARTLLDALG